MSASSPASAQGTSLGVDGWWQTSAASLPGSSSPLVPAGGLDVAQGPLGPTAMSALRVPAAAGDRLLVTLTLADTATLPNIALQACRTTSAWTPVAGGDLAAAPSVDCKGSIIGRVSAGTVSWTFGPSFIRDGFLDVGIVPSAGAEPFSAPFNPPGATAVRVSKGQAPPTTAPSASPQPGAAVLAPTTYVAIRPPLQQPSPASVAAPAAPLVASSSPSPAALGHPAVSAFARHAEGPVPRGVAWALLAALLLAAAATTLRHRKVASDEPPVRGVGRFARQHSEPAPRL